MTSSSDMSVTFFGLMSARAVLTAHRRPLRCLYVNSESSIRGLSRLISDAKSASVPVEIWPKAKLTQYFRQDVSDVALVAGPRSYPTPEEILRTLQTVADPWVVALEGVEDPHQLGEVFRTASAAGVSALIMPTRLSQLNPDVVARSSAGTSESASTCVTNQIVDALSMFNKDGFRILAADADADKSIYDVSLTGKICLVIGGRLRGLSAETLAACTERVRLPMEGGVPSLTVVSCAGAMLYEAYRQRHAR